MPDRTDRVGEHTAGGPGVSGATSEPVGTYLTVEQLNCDDRIYGVPVAFLGEERDGIVAITADWQRGAAAIHALARSARGLPARAAKVELRWARFYPLPEQYQDTDVGEWVISPCQQGDPGAMQVVWATNLTPYVAGLREITDQRPSRGGGR